MLPDHFPLQLPEASNRSHVAFRRPTCCAPMPHINKARTTKHSLGRTVHYHLLELSHLSSNLNLTLNMAVVYRRFTIMATQGAIVELHCTSWARVIAILSWKRGTGYAYKKTKCWFLGSQQSSHHMHRNTELFAKHGGVLFVRSLTH